jgi:hypothetical protein
MPRGTRTTSPAADQDAEEAVGSLADVVTTFGEKLDTIEGERVVVTRVDFTTAVVDDLSDEADEIRRAGGASPQVEKAVVIIHARPFGHPEASPERFYSFSDPLIKALREADAKGAWPLSATFEKRAFDSGKKQVWSIR